MQPSIPFSADRIPLSLVVERCEIQVGPWTTPRWQLLGIVAGAHVEATQVDAVDSGSGCRVHIWSDLHLSLYKDSAESYWHNLQSERPSLFVICRPDDTGELEPCAVTADQNEAAAYMEADDTVLSAPMPAEVYQWLEHFVVEHYQPRPPEKSHGKHRDSLYG